MKHKNTQPLYIFNRENPQNSETQNGPRRGLDFIALVLCIWSSVYPMEETLVNKRVYIDQNDQRAYIDQDVIDGPHCMYLCNF